MSLKTETKVIVDRSPMHDLLRINFNMTFTKMSCEHLTLDVSDSLGSVRPSLFQKARQRHLQRHIFMVSVGAELPVLQHCTRNHHEASAQRRQARTSVSCYNAVCQYTRCMARTKGSQGIRLCAKNVVSPAEEDQSEQDSAQSADHIGHVPEGYSHARREHAHATI